MSGAPRVVLDACVLANFSLCDTLLRLAEPPRLFEAAWSEEIIRETLRTLTLKLHWPQTLAARFQSELRENFEDAWIRGYEALIPQMTNEAKDRHVAAAAVAGKAQFILTFNLRDFRPEHLARWGVAALHPQLFLLELFRPEPGIVLSKLREQAVDRGRTLEQLLAILQKTVPKFIERVQEELLRLRF